MTNNTAISDEVRSALAAGYVRQNMNSGEPWSMTIARAILDERERSGAMTETYRTTINQQAEEIERLREAERRLITTGKVGTGAA